MILYIDTTLKDKIFLAPLKEEKKFFKLYALKIPVLLESNIGQKKSC